MFGLYVKPKTAQVWLDGCFPMKQASDSRLGSLITGIAHTIDHPTLFQKKEKKHRIVFQQHYRYSRVKASHTPPEWAE